MEEKWKPIRGFHGWYEVSNLGRVRSPEGRVTSHLTQRSIALNAYEALQGVHNRAHIGTNLSLGRTCHRL